MCWLPLISGLLLFSLFPTGSGAPRATAIDAVGVAAPGGLALHIDEKRGCGVPVGTTQDLLAPILVEWAKAHADDEIMPHELHVTRYGCRYDDKQNSAISKQAFDLLHRRYPKSEWTAKTPYWF